jgi:toxin ParE1/3/4
MARLIWTERAIEQVKEIGAFIEQNSAFQARRVVRVVLKEADKLRQFPRLGRMIPERQEDSYRELLIFSYRVFYRILDNDTVVITGVVHGRRLFDPQWVQ